MSDGESVGRPVECGTIVSVKGREAEEAPEVQAQQSASVGMVTWIAQHPRAVFAVLLAALAPYLIICVGLALAFARIMMLGTCGG